MKKFLSISLLLLLVAVMLSACMDSTPTEGVIYRVSKDGSYAEVIGYDGEESKVVIAREYNGVPVTEIYREAFSENLKITSVKIPGSVKNIGSSAFAYCTNLAEVIIEDGVLVIGYEALAGCTSLREIVIPDSVTVVGTRSFYKCYNLTSAVIGHHAEAVGYQAFAECHKLSSVVFGEGLVGIGGEAFMYCRNLASVKIPKNVRSIGYKAFSGCMKLADITVSEENANYSSQNGNLYSKDGTALIQYAVGKAEENFILPTTVTRIDDYALWYSSNIFSITIGKSLKSIGIAAFSACDSLHDVYYYGSESDFSEITIGTNNDYFTSATLHSNYTPEN